ncbi:hypothetical protein WDJ51_14845 [Rathayibacter sp. YIM 133350]|uniref:hypothetical protein n=1 Tax=Rathayibacter sp. YIM 133350 TaxID=3131992 RepID=UPI00307F61E2
MNDNLARAPQQPIWSVQPATAPAPTPAPAPRPTLRPATRPAERTDRRARPRLFYAVIAVAGISVIFLVKLLLSVAVSQGAFETSALQDQSKQLTRQQQAASEALDQVQSPQFLAANAEALGMVSNAHPVYLRLSDGAVLGQPQAADASAGGQGGARSLVPNALISDVPLVTQLPPPAAAATAPQAGAPAPNTAAAETAAATTDAAQPDAAAAAASDAPTPEPGVLPTPVTH